MNIIIKGRRGAYHADIIHESRTGSPPIGTGRTRLEAVVALFVRNPSVLQRIPSSTVTINGRPWRDAKGVGR